MIATVLYVALPLYGHAEWLILRTLIETSLIHALEFKLYLFEVCIESHSLAMYVCQINFTGTRNKFYGRSGYVDDPLPNIHCEYCYLDACLHCIALLCIQLDCVVVLGPFFLLSVVPLKNKKKAKIACTGMCHWMYFLDLQQLDRWLNGWIWVISSAVALLAVHIRVMSG